MARRYRDDDDDDSGRYRSAPGPRSDFGRATSWGAGLTFGYLLAALTILCVMFVGMLLVCSGCALVVLR